MKRLILSLFLFSLIACSPVARSQSISAEYKDENVTIQLYESPCVSKPILAMGFDAQLIAISKAAKVVTKDVQLDACWIMNDGEVDLVTEDGQTGSVPVQFFHKVDPI